MIEYLEKFKALDQQLRDAVSSPEVVKKITTLEKEFNANLSELIIRVMVKDMTLVSVPGFLVSNLKIDLSKADALYQRLQQDIFAPVMSYLKGDYPVASLSHEMIVADTLSVNEKKLEVIEENFKHLEKPQIGTKFIFDVEDEEDVAKLKEKSVVVDAVGPDWVGAADKIVRLAKLSFGSEVLNQRVKTILTTYLKGVRNGVDTKLILQKNIADGGVAMEESLADQIFLLAQEFVIKPDLAPIRPKIAVPEDNLAGRDMPYDFGKEMERLEQMKGKKKTEPSVSVVDPYSFGRPKELVGKVVMNDVKVAAPKIMNQLDELGYIDLVIFRRMSTNPEDATRKVKEKIELLEFESYHKRLEGIKAWRQSPINRVYLKICELAVADNLAVGQVIADLQEKKEAYLSPAEFVAIMKLNKELRY